MNTTQIRELLQKRKLKATTTRINLLSKMSNYGSAMSHSSIQKKMSPVDRVTLYRTIEALKEKGVIHKAYQDNNEIYYAICDIDCTKQHRCHEHIHFKCTVCETIHCEEVENTIEISLPNYKINKVSINVEGLCETFNKQQY